MFWYVLKLLVLLPLIGGLAWACLKFAKRMEGRFMAGSAPKSVRIVETQMPESASAHYNLGTAIELTGSIAEATRHYERADVFVLPSYMEGYGMALAEAVAHGLPVVSTTAGAIPETVPGNPT